MSKKKNMTFFYWNQNITLIVEKSSDQHKMILGFF